MTPAEASRPVLIVLALTLAGCGAVESDRHRFQTMADHVAAIDIPMNPRDENRPPRPTSGSGLRPANFSPVQVAVMSPHEMWDARDVQAGLRDAVVERAAPVVAEAVIQQVSERVATPTLRPAVVRESDPVSRRTIQLGAYSSEAGAREAWARLKASASLSNLSPVFEGVEVNGRTLTRLKVGPIPLEAAAGLCRAAQVADPWCQRAG